MAPLTLWGDTSEALPVLQYVCQDENWLKLLPPGAVVESTIGYGASLWSQAGKITARLPDGTRKSYFIKQSENQIGLLMSRGEYESMLLLHEILPQNVPAPLGWGTFASSRDLHFFLCEFIDIHDEQYPSKGEICSLLAKLHADSQKLSHGLFGFHVTTCNGLVPQERKWTVSWEEQYIYLLGQFFDMERARAGPSPEIDALLPDLLAKVCPRLLRPMETGTNTLRPSLVHGDFFHPNTARDKKTGSPWIFDAASFWSHNEYEFHQWISGVGRFVFDREYVVEYFRQHYPPSEPHGDWEDRNELYFLASTLMCTILWPSADRYRKETLSHMRNLIAKFPDGYTGPWKRKGLNPGEVTTEELVAQMHAKVEAKASVVAEAKPDHVTIT